MLVVYPLLLPETEHTSVTIQPSANPPTEQNNQTATLPLVRGLLQNQGLSETASTIILQAWRCGSRRQYSSYLRRWEQYCSTRKVDPISATVIDGVNSLSELYQKELTDLTVQLMLLVQLYLLPFILLRDVRLVITPWWPAF